MRRFLKIFSAGLCFAAAIAFRRYEPELLALAGLDPQNEFMPVIHLTGELMVWLFGIVLANTLTRGIGWEGLVRHSLGGRQAPVLLRQVSDLLVYFAGLLLVVRIVFDESIVAFVTALSALGVVAAFGVRGLVSDIATGLAINLESPFQIGDWVMIYDTEGGRQTGRVVEINWRTTHLVTENQNYLVIPNREIGNSTVVNYWRGDKVNRFELPVTLDYTIGTEEAKRILLAAVTAVLGQPGFVSGKEPRVVVAELGDYGVRYLVRYWLTPWTELSPTGAADLVQSSILRHLRMADIAPSIRKLENYQEPKPETLQIETEARLAANMRNLLRRVDFFAPLQNGELEAIIDGSARTQWRAGDILLRQGDPGSSMFLLMQGLLEVRMRQDNGEETRIGQLEPGDFFGEMSLLTGEPRAATVRAVTPVFALEITKESLEHLLSRRPELATMIADCVAARQLAMEQARQDHRDALAARSQKSLAAQLYARMRAFVNQP
jgi:small-conductance mechanosensitive channel/CRP-like cAMP-binding protein